MIRCYLLYITCTKVCVTCRINQHLFLFLLLLWCHRLLVWNSFFSETSGPSLYPQRFYKWNTMLIHLLQHLSILVSVNCVREFLWIPFCNPAPITITGVYSSFTIYWKLTMCKAFIQGLAECIQYKEPIAILDQVYKHSRERAQDGQNVLK